VSLRRMNQNIFLAGVMLAVALGGALRGSCSRPEKAEHHDHPERTAAKAAPAPARAVQPAPARTAQPGGGRSAQPAVRPGGAGPAGGVGNAVGRRWSYGRCRGERWSNWNGPIGRRRKTLVAAAVLSEEMPVAVAGVCRVTVEALVGGPASLMLARVPLTT